MITNSLRLDILRAMILPLAVAGLLTLMAALAAIYHEVAEVYDSTLAQYTRLIAEKTDSDLTATPSAIFDDFPSYKYERKITYRIITDDGRQITSSPAAPEPPVDLPAGFSDHTVAGKPWRFLSVYDSENKRSIIMAERYAIRHELAFQLILSIFIPALLFAIIAVSIIWRATTRGLSRLTSLSEQVDRRAIDDLSAIHGDIPVEIAGLLDALNRLLARLSDSFAREREFTDNAAHELRTPLATIKIQAQVMARTQDLSPELRQQLDLLLQGIDRATALTASLLAFARLQNELGKMENIDFADVLRKEAAGLETEAQSRAITLNVSITGDNNSHASADSISVLIRNIVQNAIKFSPENTPVDIDLAGDEGKIVLMVKDSGRGIAPEYRAKVFERFYRIEKSRVSGTGLGLAMAKWVADIHGARIDISDNHPQGTVFTATFPKR